MRVTEVVRVVADMWHRLIGWVRDEGGMVQPNVPMAGREGWLVPRIDYERLFPRAGQVVDRELVPMGDRIPYLQRAPRGLQ